ncbi:MAG: electron transfer flavoprotein subunit beta/FixA family protein [Candidatus Thermoplasmatota archaeon]|jgi:electron transfer flavoprotein beta subunit|nr:electron transfer flavoprotein subunit beta/FixA family protein [Candidatus Thermoplasmatota archaeon]MEC7350043.1 electron transfer flavoprotein subunit beta/FixA family protein [Candidatus Thermoplasmatota archaeon]MEC8073887.1 electron transfer flavoprotein subunit beta/FixA family protein [Candidatus Thermoplasmatota archaeon]MEC8671637.1 electron transfer flavoprotein subunit beta/FixA family protein [Candidatus Thermoplasmatota archaeon]MEC9138243.1 electron transfer flavoprotein subun
MNIAVLIKMVPDTESKLEVNDGTLSDQNFKYMVNPYDEFAVEQAVQFKEAEGGKVTLLSLFSEDNSIDTDLRKMLAIGADEIVVLRQNGYRGDKPLANAKVLSDAIKELDVDLVLCGIQGIDYYQAATGTMVAQMLGMPNISGVTNLEYDSGTLKAKRQIEGGLQTVETPTPAVVTCQKDMNKVRFPALKDIMMSKRKPFENKNVDSIDSNDVVTSESSLPPARDGGEIIDGEDVEDKVNKLIEKLKMEAKVI